MKNRLLKCLHVRSAIFTRNLLILVTINRLLFERKVVPAVHLLLTKYS